MQLLYEQGLPGDTEAEVYEPGLPGDTEVEVYEQGLPGDTEAKGRGWFGRDLNVQLTTYNVQRLLRVDSPLFDRVRHPVDSQHVRRDPVVHVVRLRIPHHVLERRLHDAL